jgi:hypothetical protein
MSKEIPIFALLFVLLIPVFGQENDERIDNVGLPVITTHENSKILVDYKSHNNPKSRSLLFDQNSPSQGSFAMCMIDSSFGLDPRFCDNFAISMDAVIDSIVFWGGYFNPGYPGPPLGYNIEFYPDSGGGNGPCQDPIYSMPVDTTMIKETLISGDWCVYEGTIPPFIALAGETYWLVTQMVLTFTPQFGTNAAIPPDWGDGQEGYVKSDYLGIPKWITATSGWGGPFENGFQLYGHIQGGEWIQCASMPSAEMCNATCYDPVGDHVYSLGGYQGSSSYQPFTYRYDPISDSWTTMASMPSAIDWIDASVTQWNRSIYVFGGFDGTSHNYNYIYDINANSWSTGATMPANRYAGGQVVYNDSLVYFLLGLNDSGSGTNTVYIYNTYTNSWTTGTNAPTTASMIAVAMTGDTIWIIMGWNGSSCNSNMYKGIINPANCESITWSTDAALPVPNCNGGGTQNWRDGKSYLYEVGGMENGSTVTPHAWEYDISAGSWMALPDYPRNIIHNDFLTYRRTPSVAEIYVCGGDTSIAWTGTDEVWKLSWAVGIEEEKPKSDRVLFGFTAITPNPVNGIAAITYAITRESPVSLNIYDCAGRMVRILVKRTERVGVKTVYWDGRDSNGRPVATGVYFCRLAAENRSVSKKMVVVR